jgi:hypothetical protein
VRKKTHRTLLNQSLDKLSPQKNVISKNSKHKRSLPNRTKQLRDHESSQPRPHIITAQRPGSAPAPAAAATASSKPLPPWNSGTRSRSHCPRPIGKTLVVDFNSSLRVSLDIAASTTSTAPTSDRPDARCPIWILPASSRCWCPKKCNQGIHCST